MWWDEASLPQMYIWMACLWWLCHCYSGCGGPIFWYPRLTTVKTILCILRTEDFNSTSWLLWVWLLGEARPSSCLSRIGRMPRYRGNRLTSWAFWAAGSNNGYQQVICARAVQSRNKRSTGSSISKWQEGHWCLSYRMCPFHLHRGRSIPFSTWPFPIYNSLTKSWSY
jgi:hypothetical protein